MIAIALLLVCLTQEPELHVAAARGDLATLRSFLEADPTTVSSRDEQGRTPLHHAAGRGHLEAVELLLEAGADVNARSFWGGARPIHSAVDLAVMRTLLEAGSDVGDQVGGWRRETPLARAVHEDDAERVELLLEYGADPDACVHPDSATALAAAAWYGRDALVDRLLEAGGSLETEIHGWTLAWFAARQGHAALARKLLDAGVQADLPTLCLLDDVEGVAEWLDVHPSSVGDIGPELDRTPLHWAASEGSEELVRLLIQRGARIETRAPSQEMHPWGWSAKLFAGGLLVPEYGVDPHTGFGPTRGDSPLHDAARAGNREAVQVLIEEGATIDVFSEHGVTPLSMAAAEGELEIVRDLLNAGADPNAHEPPTTGGIAGHYAERYGMRPLDGALRFHSPGALPLLWPPLAVGVERTPREEMRLRLEIGRLLIREGAVPDFIDACAFGETELVRERLAADPSLATEPGSRRRPSALICAALGGHLEIGRMLVASGALRASEQRGPESGPWLEPSPLHVAAATGEVAFATMLLEEGLDPNLCHWDGLPTWFGVLAGDSVELFDLVIEHGAELDACGHYGCTALHEAARQGMPEAVVWLLDADLAVDSTDDDLRTPLHYAVWGLRLEVIELLLESGADPAAVSRWGQTPLDGLHLQYRSADGLTRHITELLRAADRHSREASREERRR